MKTKPDWRCETLAEGAVLTMRRAGRMGVLCVSGLAWVTEEGHVEDHMLQSGQHCVVHGRGLVVIEALRDAVIVRTDPTGHQELRPLVRN